MRTLLIFFFLLLSSCSSYNFNNFLKKLSLDRHNYYFQSNCEIYNQDLNLIRQYGGQYCVFEVDGNYLMIQSDNNLVYRDKFNKIIWEIENSGVHHLINTNIEGNFLTLSSSFLITKDGKEVRTDVFSILDKNTGTVLFKYDIANEYPDFSKLTMAEHLTHLWLIPQEDNSIHYEKTHANTFYQATNLLLDSPYLSNYDYIGTIIGPSPRLIILDSKTLKLKKTIATEALQFHDTQILPDGKIIYFHNMPTVTREQPDSTEVKKDIKSRSIIEVLSGDNYSKKDSYLMKESTKFFMPYAGSVQVFENGTILVNDFNIKESESSFLFIEKNGDLIKKFSLKKTNPFPARYVKLLNLSSFLKNNIGL